MCPFLRPIPDRVVRRLHPHRECHGCGRRSGSDFCADCTAKAHGAMPPKPRLVVPLTLHLER